MSAGGEVLSPRWGLDPAVTGFLNLVEERSQMALRTFEDQNLSEPERVARFIGQNSDLRRLAIETSRQERVWRSRELTRRLESPSVDPADQFFNIVFIGAGSAETTAQLYLAKNGIAAKTLTLEADEIVARTFYDTRGYYLNSTDGPSSSDDRPLPNLGLNLNKIPNGFTQTSFIPGKKYAEAGVLGDVININRLLIPNPILFNTRVENYRPSLSPGPRNVIRLRSGREIFADLVIEAGGLGVERSSAASTAGRAYVERQWDRFVGGGEIPRYFTAVRFFQFLKHQAQPYLPFVGRTITVIGGKDFSKVVWELFERSGPPDALKQDSAEVGRYREGCWLAPGIAASCEAFTAQSRGRYLMSIPSALQKQRILPLNGRVIDIVEGPGGPRVIYLDATGAAQTRDSDFVIDAIGFTPEELTYGDPTDVIADLPVTGRAVVGREVYPGAFRVGVGSGVPVTKDELAMNDDNRASLYLNLVRVEATMKVALEKYAGSFGTYPPLPESARPTVATAEEDVRAVAVELINPDAFVQNLNFASEYVDNVVAFAMAQLAFPKGTTPTLTIEVDARGTSKGFVLRAGTRFGGGDSVSPVESERLTEVLSATPTFFSILTQIARRGPVELTWTAAPEGIPSFVRTQRLIAGLSEVGPASRRRLRGYRPPAPVIFGSPAEIPRADALATSSDDDFDVATRRFLEEYLYFRRNSDAASGPREPLNSRARGIEEAFERCFGKKFKPSKLTEEGLPALLFAVRDYLMMSGATAAQLNSVRQIRQSYDRYTDTSRKFKNERIVFSTDAAFYRDVNAIYAELYGGAPSDSLIYLETSTRQTDLLVAIDTYLKRLEARPRTTKFSLDRALPPSCFTGPMRVSTPAGLREIGSLAVGDVVWSYDLAAGRLVESVVTAIRRTPNRPFGTLTGLAEPIEVTGEHRFFTEGSSYTPIARIDDEQALFRLPEMDVRRARSIELVAQPRGCYPAATGTATVTEISLGRGPHNYFVEGVLVHNVKESL